MEPGETVWSEREATTEPGDHELSRNVKTMSTNHIRENSALKTRAVHLPLALVNFWLTVDIVYWYIGWGCRNMQHMSV